MTTGLEPVAAGAPTATALAEILADVLKVDRVDPEGDFFDDLGADSLVMAHFCARVRKQADLPSVSIKDVYRHRTIAALAAASAAAPDAAADPVETPPAIEPPAPGDTRDVVRCGALQALFLLAAAVVGGLVLARGYGWISAGTGVVDTYLRAAAFGAIVFVAMCTIPIAAKWILIGRWTPAPIRIWSLAYVRFWLVARLIRTNPMVLFVGTPLYPLYLRALGARIAPGVAIFSRNVPVCTDLLTIGAGAVVQPTAQFPGYRARAGRIEVGRVSIGRNAYVGEAAVLDIDTELGDDAQLAHASALHAGQRVGDGERRHGSPAQSTQVDYGGVDPARCGGARRAGYAGFQLLKVLALQLPVAFGGLVILIEEIPFLAALIGSEPLAVTSWAFYLDALVSSLVLFAVATIGGLLVIATLPRLLNLALTPDRVYPLYGVHYGIQRAIERMTNVGFFLYLFGDSVAIVRYFRAVGYQLDPVEQTGSNFGLETRHENPYLCSIGTGTMVADGLAMLNVTYSNSSFRVSRVAIGARNFVGNDVVYPARGRTGDDCLLATKVMVPVGGEVREGVGLLGSPPFEIPRTVQRDHRFDHLRTGAVLRRRLAAKTRHNVATMGLFLLVRWGYLFGLTLLALLAVDLYDAFGGLAIALAGLLVLPFGVGYFALVERAATGFRPLEPRYCSIYQPHFWWHERYWKLSTYPRTLGGTPFRPLMWRLLGVRIGARVFDDGCVVTEKTLVTIGDDCVLNAGSMIQPHSQEDGSFKSDRIAIGAGCTVGVGALVHYGVTMGDGATLAPDSFLMKGEDVPALAQWGGNPARESGGTP